MENFYGINKLRLSNFKSIEPSSPMQEINFSPLTLICGENSSGKSTVLQSILSVVQSTSSEIESDSVFSLNGKIIKLNNFESILHALSNEKNVEIGLDFKTYQESRRGPMTDVKFDINLTAVLEDELVSAFPKNLRTAIKLIDKSYVGDIYESELIFETMPVDNQDVVVLNYKDKSLIKHYNNYQWFCEAIAKNIDNEGMSESIYDERFAGIDFNSGIPSEVFSRIPIGDYLGNKLTEQIKTLLNDEVWMFDNAFNWIYSSDAFDEVAMKASESTTMSNLDIQNRLQDEVVSYFNLLDHESLKNRDDFDFEGAIPDNAFSLNVNLTPWDSPNYRDLYTDYSQLAKDLLTRVNQPPDFELSEFMQTLLWDITLSEFSKLEKENAPLDNEMEDTMGEVIHNLGSVFDNKFFRELNFKLIKHFDSIFTLVNEIHFFIDESNKKTQQVNDDLEIIKNVTKFVQYLGPLRMLENDEPKVLSFDENTPLGINGEFFFNYFENQKTTLINIDGEEKTIADAFNQKLQYFEIAESFYTEYSPDTDSVIGYIKPIGLDINIKMKELGVGFSQLAPIILLCLASKENSTILLEQPELHLHPKVQQKFADFLVNISQSKQIILETHSDHILNRIRRRIAQAKLEKNDSSLFENCTILFAERKKGVTNFRNANLTNSGTYDLTDFPDGFFDQGAEDAFYILKASLEDGNS
tara:strand:+ start:864 stop:2957 length:2094 start_codon:yes stop_codon:yes gene_type:complete